MKEIKSNISASFYGTQEVLEAIKNAGYDPAECFIISRAGRGLFFTSEGKESFLGNYAATDFVYRENKEKIIDEVSNKIVIHLINYPRSFYKDLPSITECREDMGMF